MARGKLHIEVFSGYSGDKGTGQPTHDIHICTSNGRTVKIFPHLPATRYLKLSTRIALAEQWIEENQRA